jgi:hypothetical protein
MEYVIMVLAFIGSMGVSLMAHEAYAKCDSWGKLIVRFSASILPQHLRDDKENEWLAAHFVLEGNITKLLHAFGCIRGAVVVRDRFERLSIQPFEDKSFTYRSLTHLYFGIDCAIAASMFFIAIPFFPFLLKLYLSSSNGYFVGGSFARFEIIFLRLFYDRFDGPSRTATRINAADIRFTPPAER